MKKASDLTGQRFGRLVVLKRDLSYKKAAYWICRCDCGNEATVQSCHLRSGATKSCGCLHMENAYKTTWEKHGDYKTRLYHIWIAMKGRCFNKKNKRYGGRGITVCPEWSESFEAFRDWALANGYRDNLTLDRKDNDGNYEPSNCRWATQKEQQNNRSNNIMLTYNEKTQTITQWAEELGMNIEMLYGRINKLGWSAERALSEPPNIQTNSQI